MRLCIALFVVATLGSAETAAAATPAKTVNYAAYCKAQSFARRGPGTLSAAMRDAEIQRCINNKGFLDTGRS